MHLMFHPIYVHYTGFHNCEMKVKLIIERKFITKQSTYFQIKMAANYITNEQ